MESLETGPSLVLMNALPPVASQTLAPFFDDRPDGQHDDSGNQRWSSFIGIITAIAGNILISFALNIQRYAHIRIERQAEGERLRLSARRRMSSSWYGSIDEPYRDDPEPATEWLEAAPSARQEEARALPGVQRGVHYEDDDEDAMGYDRDLQQSLSSDRTVKPPLQMRGRTSYLRSPYWWAGIVLMTLGEMGNFLAYGFAPASIVSPLGVVALISNCVIAPCMLKEQFRKRDFWGVCIAIAGAVIVVLSAKTKEAKFGPHDIWVMITQWEFELYMGITAVLIVTLMSLSWEYGGRTILIDLGLVGLFGKPSPSVDCHITADSGVGGYTALATKGVSSLLSFTLWHVITFPITYLLVAVLVLSALMQIRYINRALQRFDSTQVIPTQFVLFTLSVIIGSAVLYRDFESTTAAQAGKFVGGCCLTFLGVYLITSGRSRGGDDDDYSGSEVDEEETVGLMRGEQYCDSPESGRPVQKHRPPIAGVSSPESLASGNEDNLTTPKGLLSPEASDREESISDESLTHELECTPSRPHSLILNPWASPESGARAGASDPVLSTAVTEATTAEQPGPAAEVPAVELCFPTAPGTENVTPVGSVTPRRSQRSLDVAVEFDSPERRRDTPQQQQNTSPTNSRQSLTSRLAPGPLIPPISSTLSAVVADSLRRGEGSPHRHHRRHNSARGKSRTTFPEHEAREAIGDDPTVRASNRLISLFAGASRTPRQTNDETAVTPSETDDPSTSSRLRSFSDSLGGRLPWLDAAFRRTGKTPGTEPVPTPGRHQQE